MREFLRERLSLADEQEAARVQRKYFHSHGSTLAGLIRNHDIPAEAYLDYVYDVDLTGIEPAPELADPLRQLPGRRIVFTNSSTRHAERVLDRLGIRDLIDGISSITDASLVAKPGEEAYDCLVERHEIDPAGAIFFEDLPRNLLPAARRGMRTVWIRNELPEVLMGGATEDDFDHTIDDLAEFLAEITEAPDDEPGEEATRHASS